MGTRVEAGRAAIRMLLQLADDEIQLLNEELEPLKQRLIFLEAAKTQLLEPPRQPTRPKKSFTAEKVLQKARTELESLRQFLKHDLTRIARSIKIGPGEDPRTSSVSASATLPDRFRRLLCVRSLRSRHLRSWHDLPENRGKTQVPDISSRTEGWTESFINKYKFLDKKRAKQGLKIGYQINDMERNTNIAGISVVLMPAWYMFEHFYPQERERLRNLLHGKAYERLLETAKWATPLLETYQLIYDHHVDQHYQKMDEDWS